MNPFGDASAVDTASKLAELEIKESGSTQKEVEPLKAQESTKEPRPADITESKQDTPVAMDKPIETEKTTQISSAAIDKRERNRREPEIVNSRAAAFENAPNVKRDVSVLFNIVTQQHSRSNFIINCLHFNS